MAAQSVLELRIDDLDYELPPELVAQEPAPERDGGRLLRYERSSRSLSRHVVRDLAALLPPSSLVVVNDTRVVPARLAGARSSGGRLDLLVLSQLPPSRLLALIRPGHRLKIGEEIVILPDARGRLVERLPSGAFALEADRPLPELMAHGRMPLPHYIARKLISDPRDPLDATRYQTVFAAHPGAIAAPTAGLHLSERLLEDIEARGHELCKVTLHVGPGTFRPVRSEIVAEHAMESEPCHIGERAAAQLEAARAARRPIVAVGTTTVRLLESAAQRYDGPLRSGSFDTSLFIKPPFRFQVVNCLLTNFPLPRSTLLALVAAFIGLDELKRAYQEAVEHRFRFYSYGDAMFIC
jgi:S-adenosylmethionine:tRNA ribosyltransferase-isomerase